MVGPHSEEGKQGGVISVGVGLGLGEFGVAHQQEDLWLVIIYLA